MRNASLRACLLAFLLAAGLLLPSWPIARADNGAADAPHRKAVPLSLQDIDVISGATVTCFDGFEGYLEKAGAQFEPRPAICSGRIITGRSAGHALSFGLEIVGKVCPEKVEQVRHALYLETI